MIQDPVIDGFLDGLSVKAKQRIEEWSLSSIILPRQVSAMPGPRRAISYQQGFFEALEDPTVEVIVLMTSSQVGKSELLSTTALYYSVEDPSRILFVQPKDDAAEEFKSERIDPIIDASPKIKEALAGYAGNKSQDQKDYLGFPGGFLDFKGANSPTNLAGKPIRILLMDEIDRYLGSVGNEGDPVTIALKRTTTERTRKIILCSTPKELNRSRIHRLYQQTDQRRRFVTCHDCDHEQYLKFSPDTVKRWPDGEVRYHCEECGAGWDQKQLMRMERAGVWKPTSATGRRGWVGFHIWEAYSPFSSLQKILEAWEAAEGDAAEEQAFVNTTLGEANEGKLFKRTSLDTILGRRERVDKLPEGCVCITAAADVHPDRIEVMHMGHGLDDERWVLGIERLYGDVISPGLWSRVTQQLNRSFTHVSGNSFVVEGACIDAGFSTQTVVENVVKMREQGMNVHAIVGRSGQGRPTWVRQRTAAAPGKIYAVGIDEAKTELMMAFATESKGAGYVHINGWEDEEKKWHGLDNEMCEQFLAEQCEISVNKLGVETREWKNPKRKRNEALDLAVYNRAAFLSLGIDLSQRLELIYAEPLPQVDVRALARQIMGGP